MLERLLDSSPQHTLIYIFFLDITAISDQILMLNSDH